jgi:hypothetical protein
LPWTLISLGFIILFGIENALIHEMLCRRARKLAPTFLLSLLAASPVQSSGALFQEPNCPSSSQQLISDRPDISTSVTVVPQGSLQIGNGLGWTSGQGSQAVDSPQTTLRAGVAHCTEAILDLPDYTSGVSGPATSGFSPLDLAVKRQLFRLPGAVNISAEAGLGLPVANHTGSCQRSPGNFSPRSPDVLAGYRRIDAKSRPGRSELADAVEVARR